MREEEELTMEITTLFCVVLLHWLTTITNSNSLYPFLYFSEEDIPRMRRQAETTHSHIAGKLHRVAHIIISMHEELPPSDWKTFSSRWNENYGNNLCGLAMYCVLNDQDIRIRKLVFKAMDVFTSLPNWRVSASMRDDVPVAHSLNGMATAFDFLYPHMDEHQRDKYLTKIANVTSELYRKTTLRKRAVWWSHSVIQNHVATNYAAMLTGALVLSRHPRYAKIAQRWAWKAHQMLSKTLHVLQYVVDGSMDEGVSYGSYTTRSLTQYIFLAKRHYKSDLTKNIWLQEHFWFMYYTTMHNFNQTIGIADSGRRWYYGPESQLYFLDSFVLKNGYANWLAHKVQLSSLNVSGYQRHDRVMSVIHTEFIFYNASILPKPPPDYYKEQLHTFIDWGVSVYRSGMATSGNNNQSVYLSFKCGVLHGEAVNQMALNKRMALPSIKGRKGFNPGHEQVDQGSFVFAPFGIPFITDTYYGPKYTWLNDAILFGPSFNSPCSAPLEGQIGECQKWFDFNNIAAWKARGKIVTSTTEKGLVLMCGEMATWYRKELGLASVYRCLVLLSPGVLLVLDHVERKNDSKVVHMNSFFHNANNDTFFTRECWETNHYVCAGMSIYGREYRAAWVNSHGTKSAVQLGGRHFNVIHSLKKVDTSFLNISTPLYGKYTRVAYIFSGPGNDVVSLRITSAQDHGVYISAVVNNLRYTVALVTKHALPLVRFRWLGYGGFGKVNIEEKCRRCDIKYIQRQVIHFGEFNKTQRKSTKRRQRYRPKDNTKSVFILFIPAAVACAMLFLYFQLFRVVKFRFSIKCLVFVLLLVYCVISLATFLKGCKRGWCVVRKPTARHQRELYGFVGDTNYQQPPFVVYTSLPLAGSELFSELFKSNSDFFPLDLSTESFFRQSSFANVSRKRRSIHSKGFLDFCRTFQSRYSDQEYKIISQWFRNYLNDPMILGATFPQKSVSSLPSISLKDPGWALRFHWLRRVLGMRMKAMVIVRDPRSWVNTWLKEFKSKPALLRNTQESLNKLIKMGCTEEQGEKFAQEIQIVLDVLDSVDKASRDVLATRLLAQLWAGHTNALLRKVRIVPKDQIKIFRLEDLVLRPKKTALRAYQFLSLSLPPIVDDRIQLVTRTGHFKFAHTTEKIGTDMVNSWRKGLTTNQIREIESICSIVMSQLHYKPMQ